MDKNLKNKEKKANGNNNKANKHRRSAIPARLIGPLAEEIAKTVIQRLPAVLPYPGRGKKTAKKKKDPTQNALFLDTSAIIDGRIFDVIRSGLIIGNIVVPEFILSELKHIADSQDMVKRERGRRGLERLEKLKKVKNIKVIISSEDKKKYPDDKKIEIDEKLIRAAKSNKGRLITGDYNLEKKAKIDGVTTINIHELANFLKITAVPGETLHIKVLHSGKDPTQGVGYLDDGTMIVIEKGSMDILRTLNVVVSRVIQTSSGRILFAKKI